MGENWVSGLWNCNQGAQIVGDLLAIILGFDCANIR